MAQLLIKSRRRRRLATVLAGVAVSAIVSVPAAAHHPTVLRIGGTGGALGGMHLLAKSFMRSNPDTRIIVVPSIGSGGGIKALAVGKIDLALSARKLSKSERSKGLVATPYAKTPLIFATRHDSEVDSVSLADVAGIYTGRKTSWSDGSRLRLVMHPVKESDNKLLYGLSPEIKQAELTAMKRLDLHIARTDQENANALERTKGALGITTLGQVTAEERNIKPLAFNGMRGTVENLAKGTYRFSKTFYFVSKSVRPAALAEFLQFLRSPKGREILASTNHVAVYAAD